MRAKLHLLPCTCVHEVALNGELVQLLTLLSYLLRLFFFGTFAKLRKATIDSVMSLFRWSTWNNSAPNGRIFTKFYVLESF